MKHSKRFDKSYAIITIVFLTLLVCFTVTTINGADRKDEMVRSSSLQEIQINDGDVTRIEYRDHNGILTYASDKHFAICIRSLTDKGLLVEYYDKYGKPAKQNAGYYALKTIYNENKKVEEITYLGVDHKPIMISTGYSIAKYIYNDEKRIRETLFCDTNGEPIHTYSFAYGCKEQYNEEGQIVSITYIDDKARPTVTGQGFAIKHMEYYDSGDSTGKIGYVYYYDANEQPMPNYLGQYGEHIEYDEFGREKKKTYLNRDGQPTETILGYTTVLFTRYEDDRIKTETFYDQNGLPTCLSEGQYGKQYTQDGRTQYLDISGKVMINIKQELYNNNLLVITSCILVVIISLFVNKQFNFILLALYLVAIIYMTLMYRNGTDIPDINRGISDTLKKLFFSYKERQGVYNNILLFIPYGAILIKLYPHSSILIIPVITSIFIEMIQYYTGVGYCEVLDIIANSMGGAIGCFIGKKLDSVKRNAQKRL